MKINNVIQSLSLNMHIKCQMTCPSLASGGKKETITTNRGMEVEIISHEQLITSRD